MATAACRGPLSRPVRARPSRAGRTGREQPDAHCALGEGGRWTGFAVLVHVDSRLSDAVGRSSAGQGTHCALGPAEAARPRCWARGRSAQPRDGPGVIRKAGCGRVDRRLAGTLRRGRALGRHRSGGRARSGAFRPGDRGLAARLGAAAGLPDRALGGRLRGAGLRTRGIHGLAETEGPSEASGEAVPAEALGTPADGAASSGSGVVARRAGGAEGDTPGCSIGAIGGFFGNGSGVMPDTQA